MTDRDYQSLPGIRWSRLKHMLTSAAHYKHACDLPDGPESDARRLGRGIHCALLEPELFDSRWVLWDRKTEKGDKVSPRAKTNKAWVSFQSECSRLGQEILVEEERSLVRACARAVANHPTWRYHVSGGEHGREMALSWVDAETGLPCKLRLDFLANRRKLIDLKSTARLDERSFDSTFVRFSYHAQLAYYTDGLKACGFDVDPEPLIFAVETSPPWDVVPTEIPREVVAVGRDIYRGLLARIVECEKTGEYPGRQPRGVRRFELPAYAMPDPELDMTGVEGFDGGE